MAFYANLGYSFSLPNPSGTELVPQGSIILSSAMPMHQLLRRRIDYRYPNLARRLFDPQLYLSGLDANQSPRVCAKLASYPWFGITGLNQYISSQQNQSQWLNTAEREIHKYWSRRVPDAPSDVRQFVHDCIRFQEAKGCEAIILPSPLTTDPSTSYDLELLWLDAGLDYIKKNSISIPVFATVALSDICVHYTDPLDNNLLELILDSISARSVQGAYIVLEQGNESSEARHCSSTRALRSILHLVHVFTNDTNTRVAVNFLGQFGLACEAAGAEIWGSGWYKSVYRLRLTDKISGGRAYPSFWSHKAAVDIHLNGDFDKINRAGILPSIAERTDASIGLLLAASRGISNQNVPNWQYRMSNVHSAREHFFRTCIQAADEYSVYLGSERVNQVESWLQEAVTRAQQLENVLGSQRQTNTQHVRSWLDAFRLYRLDHNV